MSITLLEKDNITIRGNIKRSTDIESPNETLSLHLEFTILVNGKLKNWGASYSIIKQDTKYWLSDYSAWYDVKDLLCTLWYDLREENINDYILQFDL